MTIVVPYLLTDPDKESALRPLPAALQELVENGSVFRLTPVPETACPEFAFVGLDPREFAIAQGPLTVAALGHRPPERSVHFHLSLASVSTEGELTLASEAPTKSELQEVFQAAERLKTKTLTPLEGEAHDHALVWEGGTLEIATVSLRNALGKPIHDCMPIGEREEQLRAFIDDSINLLETLECNRVRRGEGVDPLNCLWPWGQGFRPELPNLPLRRGDVATIVSRSMRLEGLARLVGYRHTERNAHFKGLATDFASIFALCQRQRITLVCLDQIGEMQRHGRTDEIAWTLEQMSKNLIEPMLADRFHTPFEIRIAAPGGCCGQEPAPDPASETGLAISYASRVPGEGRFPFDERSLHETQVRTLDLAGFVAGGLTGTL